MWDSGTVTGETGGHRECTPRKLSPSHNRKSLDLSTPEAKNCTMQVSNPVSGRTPREAHTNETQDRCSIYKGEINIRYGFHQAFDQVR